MYITDDYAVCKQKVRKGTWACLLWEGVGAWTAGAGCWSSIAKGGTRCKIRAFAKFLINLVVAILVIGGGSKFPLSNMREDCLHTGAMRRLPDECET